MADEKIEQDDTEGNAIKARGLETGDNEVDTEGNAARFKGVEDGSAPESDDTEGNAARGKA